MTAKQKAAIAKFKQVVAEAKKLRKKNPKLTQAQAVKQAWAIARKVGAIKIIEKGESKSAKPKATYQQKRTKKGTYAGLKKVGADNFEKQKKVNDSINKKFKNWEYPVPPVYTGNWSVTTWSNWIKKHGKKIGAVKKKTASKSNYHKDTKSHNVNIRVVSGLPNYKNAVKIYFKNSKYNYTTTVGQNVTEEDAKKYFLNKYFNVGTYPKEILQKPTKIKFFKYIEK